MSDILDFNKEKEDLELCNMFSQAAEILSKPSNISRKLEDHIYKNDLMREYPEFFNGTEINSIELYYQVSTDLKEGTYRLGANHMCLISTWIWQSYLSKALPKDEDLPEYLEYDENSPFEEQVAWNYKFADILKKEYLDGKVSLERAQGCLFIIEMIQWRLFEHMKRV